MRLCHVWNLKNSLLLPWTKRNYCLIDKLDYLKHDKLWIKVWYLLSKRRTFVCPFSRGIMIFLKRHNATVHGLFINDTWILEILRRILVSVMVELITKLLELLACLIRNMCRKISGYFSLFAGNAGTVQAVQGSTCYRVDTFRQMFNVPSNWWLV